MQTIANLAWAAGLIDGEGCLGIYPMKSAARKYVATVRVQMTHRPTIDRIHRILGGTVYASPARGSRKPSCTWHGGSQFNVLRLLTALRPHLTNAAAEADLLIEFLRGGDARALYDASHAAKTRHKPRAA